jgi:hypothetical protein
MTYAMRKLITTLLILASISSHAISKYTLEKVILLNLGMTMKPEGFLYVDQDHHKFLANTDNGSLNSYGYNQVGKSYFIVEYDQHDTLVKSKVLVSGDTITSNCLKYYNENFYMMVSYKNKILIDNDSLISQGNSDIAILKFDMNFDCVAKYNIGSSIDERCSRDAFEISDNQIYLAGNVNGDDTSMYQYGNFELVIGNDTLHIDTDTFHSGCDYFISRFDLNLQPIFSKSMGGRNRNGCISLKAANNNIYILAFSDFMNNNIVGSTVFSFNIYNDSWYYLAKLNDQFNTVWYKRISPSGWGDIYINSVTLGNNNILISCRAIEYSGCNPTPLSFYFDNAPPLSPGSSEFMYSIDTNGFYKWRKPNFNVDHLFFSKTRNTFLYPSTFYNNQIFGTDTQIACFNYDAFIGELDPNNGSEKFVASICSDGQDIMKQFSETSQGKLYTSGVTYSGSIELPTKFVYPNMGMYNSFYASLDSLEYFPLQVNDVNKANEITIYPNPCHDVLNVKLPTSFDDKTKASIVDITGRKMELPVLQWTGNNTFRIAIGTWAKGTYFLNVQTSNETKTFQFRVE